MVELGVRAKFSSVCRLRDDAGLFATRQACTRRCSPLVLFKTGRMGAPNHPRSAAKSNGSHHSSAKHALAAFADALEIVSVCGALGLQLYAASCEWRRDAAWVHRDAARSPEHSTSVAPAAPAPLGQATTGLTVWALVLGAACGMLGRALSVKNRCCVVAKLLCFV